MVNTLETEEMVEDSPAGRAPLRGVDILNDEDHGEDDT
jgi:hypothetical protein